MNGRDIWETLGKERERRNAVIKLMSKNKITEKCSNNPSF